MISLKHGGPLLLLALLSLPARLHAATAAPYDLDLKELERQEQAASAKAKKSQNVKKSSAARVRQNSEDTSDEIRYTVQPGDHIFKILVVRFGMSNEAAERLVPEVARINNIPNIRQLTIGQTILIPRKGHQERVAKGSRKERAHNREEASEAAALPAKSASLTAKPAVGSPSPATPAVAPPVRVAQPAVVPAQPVPAASRPVVLSATPPAQPVAAIAPAVPAAALAAPAKALPATPAAEAAAAWIAAQSALPVATTWICSVTERDTSKIIDAVLNTLSVSWSRNRIIQSTAPNSFSIRVDRYFEFQGGRYIVSIGEFDPYNYTLIRLLEGAGYKVLRIDGTEDFETAGRKILALIGTAADFGKHPLPGGKTASGFLIPQEVSGRRVIISNDPVDPQHKWVLTQGCATAR